MIMEQEIQVKIDSYISKLKNNLNKLPEEEQIDVINEVKSHIFESLSNNGNLNLNDVLKKLGKPNEYAKLITEEYVSKLVKKGSFESQLKMFLLNMKTPFFITLLIYIVLLQINTLFLFKGFISMFNYYEMLSLVVFNIPALLEIMIPISILYSLPWAYYTMAKAYKNNSFIKSFKLWNIVLIIGFLSSISSFAIGELLVPNSNHKIVHLMKNVISRKNEKDNKKVEFDNKKSIQEQNFFEARKSISEKSNIQDKDIFNLYTKLSIYLFPFITSFFCVLLGILMTTELFNNKYLVIVNGILIPYFLYFDIKNVFSINYPIWEAFRPNLLLLSITLILLLGIFLRKDKKEELES